MSGTCFIVPRQFGVGILFLRGFKVHKIEAELANSVHIRWLRFTASRTQAAINKMTRQPWSSLVMILKPVQLFALLLFHVFTLQPAPMIFLFWGAANTGTFVGRSFAWQTQSSDHRCFVWLTLDINGTGLDGLIPFTRDIYLSKRSTVQTVLDPPISRDFDGPHRTTFVHFWPS